MSRETILSVRNLKVHFPVKGGINRPSGTVKAVDGVSFDVQAGETVAVVGESGCGKSTTGNAILSLAPITAGEVHFNGQDIARMKPAERKTLWRDLQVVFQDPVSALNPKRTIAQSIAEPLAINGYSRKEQDARVDELVALVGLNQSQRDRYPNELSGGQRQRVVIARALALNPKLVICDEPVSALDVSIQSQILNLLMELQERLGLSYLFISHDLSVVRHLADRVIVMYLGTIVEEAQTDELFTNPRHPYTRALLSAIPEPDPVVQRAKKPIPLQGELPSPLNPPAGCPFVTRCPLREEACSTIRPELTPDPTSPTHHFACLVEARAVPVNV
ncbi:ABC transporter ATP-binding protein [Nitratireductor basaltis]|uniref:Oligopeptide ABC transporter ATP-binding protein n=1 Tax=Nitratireductor basaltis TaxID=472175 RepID=A0A084U574_9HYPH|nr:oligopeptide/dipeptide ABC transporter ATP-binding protein [Nitratireductor basaltis]KFB08110.1 Oligopeptide ABC transporter ATP-binding protein [Nitratireductor basaltis]